MAPRITAVQRAMVLFARKYGRACYRDIANECGISDVKAENEGQRKGGLACFNTNFLCVSKVFKEDMKKTTCLVTLRDPLHVLIALIQPQLSTRSLLLFSTEHEVTRRQSRCHAVIVCTDSTDRFTIPSRFIVFIRHGKDGKA